LIKSSSEDISYQNYLNDDADTVVPNIVRYDPDAQEWSLLEDPDNVFPYPNAIDGVASKPQGESSHVYIHTGSPSLTLYSWSPDDSYANIAPLDIMAGSLVVDANGNPAGINMYMDSPSGNAARNYSLVYLDNDNNFSGMLFLNSVLRLYIFVSRLTHYLFVCLFD
jgi:hypothetical protein